MNRITNWKLILFYTIGAPIALIWDLLFVAIQYLYKGMSWLDVKGGDYFEKIKQHCEEAS